MKYWLDCFTGTTWEEFRKIGASVTGFNARLRKNAGKIDAGDILLCYLVGVQRWVGVLQVIGPSHNRSRIWKDADFPVRLDVTPQLLLDPEHGIPMEALAGKVSFYAKPEQKGGYNGFVRVSPNLFKHSEDAVLILDLLKQAEKNPIARPVDARKLARKPYFQAERQKGKNKESLLVSIPDSDDKSHDSIEAGDSEEPVTAPTRHTEIQFALLKLGSDMGMELWVARNDRKREWNGTAAGDLPGMITVLPTQFNEATNRTIELIDVLWLKGNSIVAAFEVECTTSIYSGLLRMSDLLALQPNLDIKLYLVAPDERRGKVEQEIQRPTFKIRDKPLPSVCGFLAFSKLMEKVDAIQRLGLAKSLKADFLESTAEYFQAESADP